MEASVQTPLGLWVPRTAVASPEVATAPALRNTGTYVTYGDLVGYESSISEEEVIKLLSRLSCADCIAHIGDLSSRLAFPGGPQGWTALQRGLVERVVGDCEFGRVLVAQLERDQPTVIFCEQQLLHLARLAILHADSRPPDGFENGQRYEDWVTCLIAVNDLLDADLVIEDPRERLSWELRQCGLNHVDDHLPATAIHFEVYRRLLPELDPKAAKRLEAAFERHTGISLAKFFTIGSAAEARFINATRTEGEGGLVLVPSTYFSSVKVSEQEWRSFFNFVARGQKDLRRELEAEDGRYGKTTYSSLTFARFPLFEGEPGQYVPISMPALQRRFNEGIIHILSEAAEDEGLKRTAYSSKFGLPFQELVERTFRRGVKASGKEVPIAADVLYGSSSSSSRRSSDVILGFERNPVFVEVVSGPLRAGTLTRGDLADFAEDLQRLVVGKAEQLDRSIRDFREGKLILEGIESIQTGKIWPVIVTSHAFPLREEISLAIDEALREAGHLQHPKVAPLSILSAEELFFCEGFMQQGETFLSLISGWKHSPGGAHSFKNYLIERANGRAPGSDHFERRFAEALIEQGQLLFESEKTVEELLAEKGRRSRRLPENG